MRALLVVALLAGCATVTGVAPPQSPGVATVDASLSCTGAGGAKWTSSYKASKVESCVFHAKEQTLDVRVGTTEEGLSLHLIDFTGSGEYRTGVGDKESTVRLVARGGTGDSTSTLVDTTAAAPCAASCTVSVPEASVATAESGGTIALEIACPGLTRSEAATCVKCALGTATLVKATAIPCRKQ